MKPPVAIAIRIGISLFFTTTGCSGSPSVDPDIKATVEINIKEFLASNPYAMPRPTLFPVTEVIAAKELVKLYDSNKVAADRLYTGKKALIGGVVSFVEEKHQLIEVNIHGPSDFFLGDIVCKVSPQNVDQILDLRQGNGVLETPVSAPSEAITDEPVTPVVESEAEVPVPEATVSVAAEVSAAVGADSAGDEPAF